jgi:hypothetical protein
MLGALFATVLGVFLAGALQSNTGFEMMLRLLATFAPFENTKPDIASSVALPLTVSYWALLSTFIGKVGRPPNWFRMAAVELIAVLCAGAAVEFLLRVAGHPRYFYIEI